MSKPWSAYWSWLRKTLQLTVGGSLIFTVVVAIGLAAGATTSGFAFYNVESGHDPDQVLLIQIALGWVAVGIVDAVLVGVVCLLDVAFRGVRGDFRART